MFARAPQQQWGRPRYVREELIVKASRVQQPNDKGFQDYRDNSRTRKVVLDPFASGILADKLHQTFARRSDPAQGREDPKKYQMRGE